MTEAPKAPPTAVRLGEDRLAHLETWMMNNGIRSRHAAILAAFDKGCGFKPRKKKVATPKKPGPAKAAAAKAVLAAAEAQAQHLAKPKPKKAPTVQQIVETTQAMRPRSRWDLSAVQTGPRTPAPGSMLKDPKRK